MDRPKSLSKVIRHQKIRHAGKLVEEAVFKTEDRGGSNDGGFWEDLSGYLFASSLDLMFSSDHSNGSIPLVPLYGRILMWSSYPRCVKTCG